MTDYDDFKRFGSGGAAGGEVLRTTAVLYGGFPDTLSPRYPDPPRQNIQQAFQQVVSPAIPRTAAEAVAAMKERIAWLENELKMHEAWKLELETLRRMVDAYILPPVPSPREEKG